MSDIALYRKYRPHNFDNFVGQDHIRTTLVNAIKTDRVSHAYLFSGPRGTGKTSAARLVAKALNCSDLKDGYELCNKCEFCTDISEGRLIDLIEIDAASNRGIDEVRDLKEKIQFAPTRSKYKIHIIDEAHMMTKEAFNALLKTLEEPPSHAYFILATTEIHKIPETIISRCQRFDFKRITDKGVMARLSYIAQAEGLKIDDKVFEAIAKYVDGGLRDAIGIMEQLVVDGKISYQSVKDVLGLSDHDLVEDLYTNLMNEDVNAALSIIHLLHDQGSDLRQFTHELICFLRENLLSEVHKNDNEAAGRIIEMIDVFQAASEKISASTIPQLSLEIAVIQIAGDVVTPSPDVRPANVKSAMHKPSPSVVAAEAAIAADDKAQAAAQAVPATPTPAKPVSEKTVIDAPVSSSNTESEFDFTIEEIKQNWPRVTERIKKPSLRMSLKNSVPTSINDSTLLLTFNTVFHKDKVMEHDGRAELEAVFAEVFKHPVKISSEVKEIEIMPIKEEILDEPPTNDSAPISDIDQALDIFGGEVV